MYNYYIKGKPFKHGKASGETILTASCENYLNKERTIICFMTDNLYMSVRH